LAAVDRYGTQVKRQRAGRITPSMRFATQSSLALLPVLSFEVGDKWCGLIGARKEKRAFKVFIDS